jgi:hypothetical protein
VLQAIAGGEASTAALADSTEAAQFYERAAKSPLA